MRYQVLLKHWKRKQQEALVPLNNIDAHLVRIERTRAEVQANLEREFSSPDPALMGICDHYRRRCREELARLAEQKVELQEARVAAEARVREAATQHRRLEILEEREQKARFAAELRVQGQALDEWGLRRKGAAANNASL